MISTRSTRGPRRDKANLIWLAAFGVYVAAVVFLVLYGRGVTLREMDTPEAHAQWQAWREAPPNQDTPGPVRRQPPSASEPPALLLMRDHFAVVMSGAVIFSSLLFAAIMMAARGVLSSTKTDGGERQYVSRPPGGL